MKDDSEVQIKVKEIFQMHSAKLSFLCIIKIVLLFRNEAKLEC